MQNKPLVSICMATYNGEKYLQEQLNSIVNQTYENIELIVQDDASTDGTIEIIRAYADKINLILLENNSNVGYVKNFSSLIQKAKGEYIALCDQDDIWDSNKITTLVEKIGNSSLVYSNSMLIDERGVSLNKRLSQDLNNNFIDANSCLYFVFDNCVSAHAMLFKRELLQKIDNLNEKVYFDTWIAATAASLHGVKYVDRDLVYYRQHTNNSLRKKRKKKKNILTTIVEKVDKKTHENVDLSQKVKLMCNIKTISEEEKSILEKLLKYLEEFQHSWFNKNFYDFLKQYENVFFAITKKKRNKLILKKAIGKRLYMMVPFL